MATSANDMTAKLVLEAEARGQASLRDMAERVRELGKDAGDAQPGFAALAEALDDVADQQGLIDAFRESKRAVTDLTQQLGTAATQVDALAAEQERAAKAAADAAAAQAESASQLATARAAQDDYKTAVVAARVELIKLREAGKAGMTPELARSAQEAAQKLKDLQASARESAQQVKLLATEQKQSSKVAKEAAAAQKDAATAYDRQVAAAGRISGALGEQRRALDETRQAMQAVGLDAKNLQAAQAQVTERIHETGQRLIDVSKLYDETGSAARRAGADGQAGMAQMADGADALQQKVSQVAKAVTGLFAASKLKGFAEDALHIADNFREMAERVRMASASQEEFELVQRRLLDTANRTYRPLAEQQELYIRSADALRNLGYETEQILDVTDSFSFLLTNNAATGERAASAVDALSRALQTGRIDARAWQTILAATPSIVDAIAESTGKTTEEIRKLGIDGKLSLRDVTEALRKTKDASREATDAMATTVQDALNNLRNTWGEYLRTSKQAEAARDAIVSLIGTLAENLETLVSVATNAGQVVLAIFGAKAVMAVRAYSVALLALNADMAGVGVATRTTRAEIDAARASMQRFAGAIRAIAWAELAIQVYGITQNLIAWRREVLRTREAQESLDATSAELSRRLAELSESTGLNIKTQQDFRDAVADGSLVFDEAIDKWVYAGDVQERLAQATQKTVAELKALAAIDLIGNFAALKDAGTSTADALKQAFADLDLDKSEDVEATMRALAALANTGQISFDEMGSAWGAFIEKMDAAQLRNVLAAVKAGVDEYKVSAEAAAQINEQVLARSFEIVGANAAQALGRISDDAQEAIDNLDLIAQTMRETGASAEQMAAAIEMAFNAAAVQADSLQALDTLDARLTSMAASGNFAADALDRMRSVLEAQRRTIEDQIPGIQSLEEALRKLGVTPQRELERLAREARAAFDVIAQSSDATVREVNESWRQMAEATIAANDGIADAALQAQARQHGFVIEADKAGRAIVKSMDEAADATKKVGDAADDSADRIRGMGDAARDAADGADDAAAQQQRAVRVIVGSWLDAEAAASRYSSEIAALVFENGKNIRLMTEQHAQLVATLERLDAQQRKLQETQQSAARGVDELRMRLLELDGTEEDIARARNARDKAEVEQQLELMRIALQRAQLRRDDSESDRLTEEIRLLGEQLVLLDKIFAAEKKQRDATSRDQATRPTGTAPGTSGGRAGGVDASTRGAPAPINITVNANGINDPVQLARRIQPELARLARLSR